MKFFLFAALLIASGLNVEAKSLAQALHEWSQVLALNDLGLIWSVRIGKFKTNLNFLLFWLLSKLEQLLFRIKC